ncbi:MAG: hypothetical protein RL701_7227 [Pseudomonadota bacterium]
MVAGFGASVLVEGVAAGAVVVGLGVVDELELDELLLSELVAGAAGLLALLLP